MKLKSRLLLFVSLVAGPLGTCAYGQFMTADSQVDQYIAQIADGGPPSSGFTTRFRILNSGVLTGSAATGTITFFAEDGSALNVTLGQTTNNVFNVSVPPGGSVTLETSGTAPTIRQGFARFSFDSPVQVTAEFRNFQNQILVNAASVNGATPSPEAWYSGDLYTGIALANPNAFAINCSGEFIDPAGGNPGANQYLLNPFQQISFNLSSVSIPESATSGSFRITCRDATGAFAGFVSLGINGNSHGITSSLPNSALSVPAHHYEDIEKVFAYLSKTIRTNAALGSNFPFTAFLGTPQLVISGDNSTVNACIEFPSSAAPCNGAAGTVEIWQSMAELMGDSPSELAFVVAHEFGHLVQRNLANGTGFQPIFAFSSLNSTFETDADRFALIVMATAGYDVYGASGALGKLAAMTSVPTLNAQFEQNVQSLLPAGMDMHASIVSRLSNLVPSIAQICPSLPNGCTLNQSGLDPHFPATLPAMGATQIQQ
jgi:hypothetical protein